MAVDEGDVHGYHNQNNGVFDLDKSKSKPRLINKLPLNLTVQAHEL